MKWVHEEYGIHEFYGYGMTGVFFFNFWRSFVSEVALVQRLGESKRFMAQYVGRTATQQQAMWKLRTSFFVEFSTQIWWQNRAESVAFLAAYSHQTYQ